MSHATQTVSAKSRRFQNRADRHGRRANCRKATVWYDHLSEAGADLKSAGNHLCRFLFPDHDDYFGPEADFDPEPEPAALTLVEGGLADDEARHLEAEAVDLAARFGTWEVAA